MNDEFLSGTSNIQDLSQLYRYKIAADSRKNKNCLQSKHFLPEIIWFADVPIFERDRPAVSHPEKGPFFSLIGTRRPKMFMTETEILDMLLKSVVFLLRSYTRQMHSMITAVLRSSVPICLRQKRKSEVTVCDSIGY